MIKLYCDRCGNDCGNIARDIIIYDITNPVPKTAEDDEKPKLTSSNIHKRLLICSNCYRKTGLPNLYEPGLMFHIDTD